jgi:very-short-patch-repair endonuclease
LGEGKFKVLFAAPKTTINLAFKVLRFWNNDVIENMERVLEVFRLVVLERVGS